MTIALSLYRGLTGALSPLVPMLYKKRLAKGKEQAGKLDERLARALPARPSGTIVWMHGASIGESKLLLGVARELAKHKPDLFFLFTSQTTSSADIIIDNLPANARQQMAPIDTPAAAARFVRHWSPMLAIFAEGEIWPNLLRACRHNGVRTALINARMTQKSLHGWQRAPKTARTLLASFDLILAANQQTAIGLSRLRGTLVPTIGNLKTALAASDHKARSLEQGQDTQIFAGAKTIILGASTHAGEEALLLGALAHLPKETRLILAPRHPARAGEIEALILATGRLYARRTSGHDITPKTQILLADTFGEMETWYRIAHLVYLGGGHSPGIGGHSPLEPLSFGLPIMTGPNTDSFSDTYDDLRPYDWVHIADTPAEIAKLAMNAAAPDAGALADYFSHSQKALVQTLEALLALLSEKVIA